MINQSVLFSDASSAWEQWMLTEFDFRSKCLLSIKGMLDKANNTTFSSILGYHVAHSEMAVGQTQHLIGPTGETNELYTAGRGVTLLVQESDVDSARVAIFAQLSAALVSGNSVIVCSDDSELVTLVSEYFLNDMLPKGLVQLAARDTYHSLISQDIRTVGYVGSDNGLQKVNQDLANLDGVIVSVVAETDLDLLPTSQDPRLSNRFITERTRTINITAIGGNASLLELGSGEH